MKKIIFLLLVLVGLEAIGQDNPIKPYKEDGYSIRDAQNLFNGYSNLSKSFQKEMVDIIENNLFKAGKVLVLNEKNGGWIFKRIRLVSYTLKAGYITSGLTTDGKIEFFPDKRRKDILTTVGVFTYDKVKIILFNAHNLNLLKVPYEETKEDLISKIQDAKYLELKKEIKDLKTIIINNSKQNQKILKKQQEEFSYTNSYYPTTVYVASNRSRYRRESFLKILGKRFLYSAGNVVEGVVLNKISRSFGFGNYYGYDYGYGYGYGYGNYGYGNYGGYGYGNYNGGYYNFSPVYNWTNSNNNLHYVRNTGGSHGAPGHN